MPVRDKSLKPFNKFLLKTEVNEMNVCMFMVGFLIGTCAGIFTMCLVQINRDTEKELHQVEIREEIRKAEEEKCKETS